MEEKPPFPWAVVGVVSVIAFVAGLVLIHPPAHTAENNAAALRVVGAVTWSAIASVIAAVVIYIKRR